LGESPKLGRDVLDDSEPPGSAGRTLGEIEVGNRPRRDGWSYLQQASAEFQQGAAMPVRQKSEMADAHESLGQDVQEEAPQELARRKGHLLFLVAVCVVPPKEGDVAVGDLHDAVIGNGHAVRVAGQIAQHLFGTAKGRLGINDPLGVVGSAEERLKGGLRLECGEAAMELESPFAKSRLQQRQELAAEHTAQNLHR